MDYVRQNVLADGEAQARAGRSQRRAVHLGALLLGVILCWSGAAWAQSEGSGAEWLPARHILLHTPGEEVFVGVIHPESALYENTFDVDKAAAEHRAYIETLRKLGVSKVETVTDVLLKDTENPGSGPRKDLIALARRMTTLDVSRLRPEDQERQRREFEITLARISPRVLVRMVLQRPTIVLRYTLGTGRASTPQEEGSSDYNVVADYQVSPLMNLYFTRDQMITTSKGVVLGRLANPQRGVEREVMQFVLGKMGIRPIHVISGEASRLEGGDFLPAGERVFIGEGLRTNAAAIREMLEKDVFGAREVVVVKDAWRNQQEMHLDTYFNIIDQDLAVLESGRNLSECNPSIHKKCLLADVWTRQNHGRYELTRKGVNFVKLLGEYRIQLIPVSEADQAAYGINFLTLGRRRIVGVDGVSAKLKRDLADAKVTAEWIDFSNLKLGYGAAHCTTQVLRRGPAEVLTVK